MDESGPVADRNYLSTKHTIIRNTISMEAQKIALVTGANRGIGFETAKQLGERGNVVIVGANKREEAVEAAETLVEMGVEAYPLQLDIAKQRDRDSAASFISLHFGRLDILVNNPTVELDGFLATSKTLETTPEELQKVFELNLFSIIYLTRTLIPLLKKSKAGRIVNVSSILGSLTLQALPESPLAGFRRFSYNASKAALNAFTIHLAKELEETKIKVNSADPGLISCNCSRIDFSSSGLPDAARTTVALALVEDDGPSGKFLRFENELPW